MIFNCSSCGAGHSVPVSMIPNGGLEMTCRRCGEEFLVTLPDRSEMPEPPPLPDSSPESTSVGVSNPFDTDSLTESKPSPGEFGLDCETQEEIPDTTVAPQPLGESGEVDEKPTTSIPADHRLVPLSPDERGKNPELDETIRLSYEEQDTGPIPYVERGLSETQERSPLPHDLTEERSFPDLAQERSGPPPPPLDVTQENPEVTAEEEPGGLTADDVVEEDSDPALPPAVPRVHTPKDQSYPSDVYERVAKGEPVVSEEPLARPQSEIKPWNEPSVVFKPRNPARFVAELLNTAPLAIRVALIVFPVTLGLVLFLTATNDSDDRIQIPIEPSNASKASPAKTTQPDKAVGTEISVDAGTARSKVAPKIPEPVADDPAPDEFAFVQVEKARLRSRVGSRGQVVSRLPMGQLVRTYAAEDGWSLVMVEPRGPAGFISSHLLGQRKPIELLAEEMAFTSCVVKRDETMDDCRYTAKRQHDRCLLRCGTPTSSAPDSVEVRCSQACSTAFDTCLEGCSGSLSKKRKKRRRR